MAPPRKSSVEPGESEVGRPRSTRLPPRTRAAVEAESRTGSSSHPLAAADGEAPAGEPAGASQLPGDGLEALDPEPGAQTLTQPLDASGAEVKADEDFEDEPEVDDGDATRAGPPLKLEIVAGPDAGARRRFTGVRLVVGRAPGVDLRLKDDSVSRRHLELLRGDGGVLLRDLGSGNGTRVNGTLVAEQRLEHGDEIALGSTRIRFLDEVAAFQKARAEAGRLAALEAEAAEAAEAPAPAAPEAASAPTEEAPAPDPVGARAPVGRAGRLRLAVVGVGATVALLGGLSFLVRTPAPPPVNPARVAAAHKLEEARAALQARDFQAAIRLTDEAERLDPSLDTSHLGHQARDELAYARGLGEARAHLAAARFPEARAVLVALGPGPPQGAPARAALEQELALAEVAWKRGRVAELLAAGEPEQARALVGELPEDQRAESARQVADYERQLVAQRQQDQALDRRQAVAAAAARRSQREEAIAEAFATVERKFAQGEWDRAASECNRVVDRNGGDVEITARARQLQAQIPAFGRAFDEGMQRFRQGALVQAARPLGTAWQLYGPLQLTANQHGAQLRASLGGAALAAGREALLREDLVTAAQRYRDAVRVDPQDPRAQAGLAEVLGKARELFEQAASLEATDPGDARRKLAVVEQVTEAGSPLHEQARGHLAALRP